MGLCGSGIIDVISELFRTEIIDARGKFRKKGRRICHDENGVGSYVLAFQEKSAGVKDIVLTDVDIVSFIRAKGAIFSAIRTMMVSLDFDIPGYSHRKISVHWKFFPVRGLRYSVFHTCGEENL